jgi:hypothetical protein
MSICLIGSVDLSVAEHLKGFYSGYVNISRCDTI